MTEIAHVVYIKTVLWDCTNPSEPTLCTTSVVRLPDKAVFHHQGDEDFLTVDSPTFLLLKSLEAIEVKAQVPFETVVQLARAAKLAHPFALQPDSELIA